MSHQGMTLRHSNQIEAETFEESEIVREKG